MKLRADYKGKRYVAKLRKNGIIQYNGQLFTSPSFAGMAITKTVTLNGWRFWKFKNDEGEWVWIEELRKRRPKKKQRKSGDEQKKLRKPALAPYIRSGLKIRADYKGECYEASVRGNGIIYFKGDTFTSPSSAGKAVTGTFIPDGWLFWKFKNGKGEWVILDELRKRKGLDRP
jgi:hypothetical protein